VRTPLDTLTPTIRAVCSIGEPDPGYMQRNAEVDAEPRVYFTLSMNNAVRSRVSTAVGLITVVALTWPIRASDAMYVRVRCTQV